jgi:hypothetical protein
MFWDGIKIVSKQISKLFNWYQYAQYSMLFVDMIINIMWNDICDNMFWDDIEIILTHSTSSFEHSSNGWIWSTSSQHRLKNIELMLLK